MPINIEPLLVHALPLLVVMCRVGGLLLTAPLLSSSAIPRQVKVLLLVALSASVYPSIDHSAVPLGLDLYTLAPIAATEMAIGLTIGLVATLPLYAAQLGGLLMGQQMGLGIAQVVNPASDIAGDSLGQMLYMTALISFAIVGGLELVVGATVETFRHVPLGSAGFDERAVELVARTLHAGFVVALRVSLPVVLIIFLENVVVGFLMRTIPGLNILNFGFPLRILLGLLTVLGSLVFISMIITADIDRSADEIMRWVRTLTPGAGVGDG